MTLQCSNPNNTEYHSANSLLQVCSSRPGTFSEQVDDGIIFEMTDGCVTTNVNSIEICSMIH